MEIKAKPEETCCPIVELRQYTLHPGKRDVLIDLFDRQFIEPQEALGMKIIGQFRDVDDRNRFVWLRGFRDMASRAQALQDFYGGPVWKAHREAANATMVDSDNVLLLRPASPASGFSLENRERLRPGSNDVRKGLVVATIYYFNAPVSAGFAEFFEQTVQQCGDAKAVANWMMGDFARLLNAAGIEIDINVSWIVILVLLCRCAKMKMFLSGSRASTIKPRTNFTPPLWLGPRAGKTRFRKNWRGLLNDRRRF